MGSRRPVHPPRQPEVAEEVALRVGPLPGRGDEVHDLPGDVELPGRLQHELRDPPASTPQQGVDVIAQQILRDPGAEGAHVAADRVGRLLGLVGIILHRLPIRRSDRGEVGVDALDVRASCRRGAPSS